MSNMFMRAKNQTPPRKQLEQRTAEKRDNKNNSDRFSKSKDRTEEILSSLDTKRKATFKGDRKPRTFRINDDTISKLEFLQQLAALNGEKFEKNDFVQRVLDAALPEEIERIRNEMEPAIFEAAQKLHKNM